jgi:anti-sigma factor ChrR (cupin superfamily)
MPDDDNDINAAALGLVDDADKSTAPAPDTTALEASELSWMMAFAPLDAAADTAPPSALWARIEARLTLAERIPGSRTIDDGEGAWESLGPGIERKLVLVERESGKSSYFIRMGAGSQLPAHLHRQNEYCVVLEGELEIEGETFGSGAFHFVPIGAPHPVLVARTDALFFIHGAL